MEAMTFYISKNIQGINKETMVSLITSAGGIDINEKNKQEA